LTDYSLGTSNPTIKFIRQILLIVVTLLETHLFLPIKILLFFNLILKIKPIKQKKREREGWLVFKQKK
jgi:hypothetical protein